MDLFVVVCSSMTGQVTDTPVMKHTGLYCLTLKVISCKWVGGGWPVSNKAFLYRCNIDVLIKMCCHLYLL